ncbi:DODA-type extradiol aromatic ring-opening family dioxygenase [Paenibacillus crassostreae]|uniref:Dioxygenase n=1 Tax=Paenibacillus crassostreae TaxID=1763538 RepID=A0A162KM23_9BACL|nr:class III extradiol ring-cleavage dioxygenase [Paenibacillus crassostreae]AOZ93592.1 dioxygenase [Paenibacillus crassostreae]OAB71625.1 dioxygenase [Paenibacillus crassostreae]
MTLPSLFVAHGSPMLALEDHEYVRFLQDISQQFRTPKAIVLFSAHWDTPDQSMTVDETHSTMHDFYGFPEEMYKLNYPAAGDLRLNAVIDGIFKQKNLHYVPIEGRGLDHGAWVILQKMYPEANIPVIELSVDSKRSPKEQYDIGSMLAELRKEDVLVIASGGLVHNLRKLNDSPQPDAWAVEFDNWIVEQLEQWDLRTLFEYEHKAPHAEQAVPRYAVEHFIPLFYAMGAADDDRTAKRLFQDYQYGNLSLNCWMFGS